MTVFRVEIAGDCDLSIKQVWPFDDGPAKPTAADVAEVMRNYGTLGQLLREWNLPMTVTVDGVEAVRNS